LPKKKKIAVYAATGCRACEQAILDIHFQVGSLTRWTEFSFWPYILGSEWEKLEEQPEIDVCFFTGAIKTKSDRQAALRLRDKSRLMIALGACAAFGGLPGLINMAPSEAMKESGEETNAPNTRARGKEEEPDLPQMEERVSALSQVVEVEYFVPGCPPRQNFLWAAIQAIAFETESPVRLSFSALRLPQAMAQAITSGVLPPKGSVFSGERAVCASCSRTKEEKHYKRFFRPWQKDPEQGRCILEQGFICQGIITREGCGGVCTAVGLPCRGCFGKTDEVFDPGPKMISAISSNLDSDDPAEIATAFDPLVDLAGTVYRYTLASQCALLSLPSRNDAGERNKL
jgi:F420-non-reducing hydrogenase small subunit